MSWRNPSPSNDNNEQILSSQAHTRLECALLAAGTSVAPAGSDMLRIFAGIPEGGSVILRLEGQVRGRWVEELRHSCNDVLQPNGGQPTRLVLDLAEVSFIDADGVSLFRDLSSRHVTLSNCSLFATELLRGMEQEQ
jgi:hypothetical protein